MQSYRGIPAAARGKIIGDSFTACIIPPVIEKGGSVFKTAVAFFAKNDSRINES